MSFSLQVIHQPLHFVGTKLRGEETVSLDGVKAAGGKQPSSPAKSTSQLPTCCAPKKGTFRDTHPKNSDQHWAYWKGARIQCSVDELKGLYAK